MKVVTNIQIGSDAYGVYIPEAKDIILNKHNTTEKQFSLQEYVKLLVEGNTTAISMLSAPEEDYLCICDDVWDDLLANKDKLVDCSEPDFKFAEELVYNAYLGSVEVEIERIEDEREAQAEREREARSVRDRYDGRLLATPVSYHAESILASSIINTIPASDDDDWDTEEASEIDD